MAASDDPSAEGAAAAGDDFGVRLSWPEEMPASTHRRRPVRRLDVQTAASASPAGSTPVLPELAARVEELQTLVRAVGSRVDSHHDGALAAIEALSVRIDERLEPGGLDPDAIGSLVGGIDSLASDIAELRTEVGQLKRRGAASSQLSSEVAQVSAAMAELGSEIAALNAELAHVKRRLPVRAKTESDAVLVEAIVAAVNERLGSEVGAQIAEVVVNRLFDVVEVVEVDEAVAPEPPPAPPTARPGPAKRRPSRRATGRR